MTVWDERASLGAEAGTRDLQAKTLAGRFIDGYMGGDGLRVLDMGCGNGITAHWLADRFPVTVLGIDASEAMIDAARRIPNKGGVGAGIASFRVGDVLGDPLPRPFHRVITERCLINLPDWETQAQAILRLVSYLEPGGIYLMLENSQDRLDSLNEVRALCDLPAIQPPAHNRYLRDAEVMGLLETMPGIRLDVIPYSGLYYFLSRVVNAWLSALEGRAEPEYDADVNRLALKLFLPPGPQGGVRLPQCGVNIPSLSQGMAWVWRKP